MRSDEATKLLALARSYCEDASLADVPGDARTGEEVVIPCTLFGEPETIRAVIEDHSFAIHVGALLVLDKVEEQPVSADDVSMFLDDLLGATRDQRASVIEYALFGQKAYTLQVENSTLRGHHVSGHTQYRTLAETIVEKFGKKLRSSLLTFRKP